MEDYTGLASVAWELFSGEEPGPDYHFFRRAIEQNSGPALDVGCGTGRLLVPLLASGLEVEGVDPSEDMLAICRRRAAARELDPVLYRQAMQDLYLPRAYRTIFVPCGSFQLVIDRREAFEALRRFHAHLEPEGVLILTIFNRWVDLTRETLGEWTFRARQPLPDGTELAKHARADSRDLIEQTLSMTVRYQRLRDDRVVEEQLCTAPERWYFKHEMVLMLERIGFRDIRVRGNYTEGPFVDGDYVMALLARR